MMARDIVLFLLGVLATVVVSIYNTPIQQWSERRRITKRLKKLEQEKTLYRVVLRLRTDEVFRNAYFLSLRARLSFFCFLSLIFAIYFAMVSIGIKPKFKLFTVDASWVTTLIDVALFHWIVLAFAFFLMVGWREYSKIMGLSWRLIEFDSYRQRIRKEWPHAEWDQMEQIVDLRQKQRPI